MSSGRSPSGIEDRKQVRSVASQLSQLPQFSCDPCQRQDVQAPVERLSGRSPGICFLDKGLLLPFAVGLRSS